eukprot:238892-Rhodomonas_salina.1
MRHEECSNHIEMRSTFNNATIATFASVLNDDKMGQHQSLRGGFIPPVMPEANRVYGCIRLPRQGRVRRLHAPFPRSVGRAWLPHAGRPPDGVVYTGGSAGGCRQPMVVRRRLGLSVCFLACKASNVAVESLVKSSDRCCSFVVTQETAFSEALADCVTEMSCRAV